MRAPQPSPVVLYGFTAFKECDEGKEGLLDTAGKQCDTVGGRVLR